MTYAVAESDIIYFYDKMAGTHFGSVETLVQVIVMLLLTWAGFGVTPVIFKGKTPVTPRTTVAAMLD